MSPMAGITIHELGLSGVHWLDKQDQTSVGLGWILKMRRLREKPRLLEWFAGAVEVSRRHVRGIGAKLQVGYFLCSVDPIEERDRKLFGFNSPDIWHRLRRIEILRVDRCAEFFLRYRFVVDGGKSDDFSIYEIRKNLRGIDDANIGGILFPQLRALC